MPHVEIAIWKLGDALQLCTKGIFAIYSYTTTSFELQPTYYRGTIHQNSQSFQYIFLAKAHSALNSIVICLLLATRPPEPRFESQAPLSYSADIWSLAVTVWGILGIKALVSNDYVTEYESAIVYAILRWSLAHGLC